MPEGPQRLAIVMFDGAFDRVHYALVMASAAAATNRAVTLFFAGPAVRLLVPEGWRRLAGEPEEAEAALAARGLAGLPVLLAACRELGVRFIACELAMRRADLTAPDLDPGLEVEVAGAVTFLNQAPAAGAILFI